MGSIFYDNILILEYVSRSLIYSRSWIDGRSPGPFLNLKMKSISQLFMNFYSKTRIKILLKKGIKSEQFL
ncbi:hypothetical protein DLM76_20335 [Leptospira yasudae]|nr:hypothetical protein DLM76_20335 [Leptospira yasudae]